MGDIDSKSQQIISQLESARSQAASLEAKVKRRGPYGITSLALYPLGFAVPLLILIFDSAFFNSNFLLMACIFIGSMGLGVAAQKIDESEKEDLRQDISKLQARIKKLEKELSSLQKQ